MGTELDYDRVIADYAAGRPVEEIEAAYGLTRAEIWRAAEGEPEPVATPRAPGVVIAAALLVLVTAAYESLMVHSTVGGTAGWIAAGAGAVIYALVAYGIWRGWRGSQVLAVLGAGLAVLGGFAAMNSGRPGLLGVVTGGALIALLVVPQASRDWFAR